MLGVVALASVGGAAYAARTVDRRLAMTWPADTSGAPFAAFGAPAPPPPAATGNGRMLPPPWEPAPLTALADWVPAPPTHPLVRAAAYVWALPMTVLGLVAGAASGGRPVVRDGVLLFSEAAGPTAALLRLRGFRATAMGHVVIARGAPDDELMAHELVHVRQAERFGAFFGPLYVALLAIYGYRRHPMERAARAGARQR